MVFLNKKVNRERGYPLIFVIIAFIFDLIGLFIIFLIKESVIHNLYSTPFTLVGTISGYMGYKRGMFPHIGSSSLGIGLLGLLGMIIGVILFFLCSGPLLYFFIVSFYLND